MDERTRLRTLVKRRTPSSESSLRISWTSAQAFAAKTNGAGSGVVGVVEVAPKCVNDAP